MSKVHIIRNQHDIFVKRLSGISRVNGIVGVTVYETTSVLVLAEITVHAMDGVLNCNANHGNVIVERKKVRVENHEVVGHVGFFHGTEMANLRIIDFHFVVVLIMDGEDRDYIRFPVVITVDEKRAIYFNNDITSVVDGPLVV